uniref:Urotensin 2, alpha n=1 Tax=Hucho hucho TaxID=62062 RepID=A0A4W5LZL6_9TELE
MMFNLLLLWTFLLVATGPLSAHPITDSAEMPYPGPVSVEDGGAGSPDELSFSEQTYSSLLSGDLSRDVTPREVSQHILSHPLNSQLNPFSRFFGIRKQCRKREGASECFWKYCV